MKIKKVILLSIINMFIFSIGFKENNKVFDIQEVSLNEAKKISSKQGYTLKSEISKELYILSGYSNTFDYIKEASLDSGYLEEDFNSMTKDRKILAYELKEKSHFIDDKVYLCLVSDKEKIIGAYLDNGGFIFSINDDDFILK